jgi:MYXO-CTERM domain-containing protein
MTDTSRRVLRQMSVPLTALAAAVFAGGVGAGLISYLDRSPVRESFVPGSSAWWQHAGVALLAVALLGVGQRRHRRRFGPRSGRLWLLAPLGRAAARRVARTVSAAPGRVLLALLPALLFSYGFYRAGLQVIGGLDPNFTVNAWGGPTYPGAMACHYLDLLVLMGAAAWLLDKILLPDAAAVPPASAPAPSVTSASHIVPPAPAPAP